MGLDKPYWIDKKHFERNVRVIKKFKIKRNIKISIIDNYEIYFLGTSHVSKKSSEEAKQVIFILKKVN
jgi:hypothetical protein